MAQRANTTFSDSSPPAFVFKPPPGEVKLFFNLNLEFGNLLLLFPHCQTLCITGKTIKNQFLTVQSKIYYYCYTKAQMFTSISCRLFLCIFFLHHAELAIQLLVLKMVHVYFALCFVLCAVTLYCSSKPLGLFSGCTSMVFIEKLHIALLLPQIVVILFTRYVKN